MAALDTSMAVPSPDVAGDRPGAAVAESAIDPSVLAARSSTADRDARRAVNHAQHLQRVQHRLDRLRSQAAFRQSRSVLREGDVVIVYSSPVLMSPVQLQSGAIHSNRYGHFHHDDFIGRPAGSRISARQRAGFVYALPVSPQLWTLSLTHRTQILYFADIALTLAQLNVQPGHVLLESGTGSGSLTVALANAVAPHGHVHTFEFNSERVSKARLDFDRLRLTPHLVSVHQRDVCALGFPFVPAFADSIFLDLPSPWRVIDSCKAALRHCGRLASFSPCIEQVQRTVRRMEEAGFADIRTMECLQREYEVGEQRMDRAADRRQQRARSSGSGQAAGKGNRANGKMGKRKVADGQTDEEERRTEEEARSNKKPKEEEEKESRESKESKDSMADDAVEGEKKEHEQRKETAATSASRQLEADISVSGVVDAATQRRQRQRTIVAGGGQYAGRVAGEGEAVYPLAMKAFPLSRGHTGYLTYCTCVKLTD